jgi:2'-5' RNA ligase
MARPDDKSALLIRVPEAERWVGGLRAKYDLSVQGGLPDQGGLPPHITVLAPMLHPEALAENALEGVRACAARHAPFDFELVGVCGFPGVVYLAAQPLEIFDALSASFAAEFPQWPPYRGTFARPVPHLTVGVGTLCADLSKLAEEAVEACAEGLPIRCHAAEVELWKKLDGRWSRHVREPLAAHGTWHGVRDAATRPESASTSRRV